MSPPSRSCMRGRWWGVERGRMGSNGGTGGRDATSVSLLHTREVVGPNGVERGRGRRRGPEWGRSLVKHHLRLALAREGGGGGKDGWKGEKEPRQKSWLVGATHLVGLPLSGSPLLFLPPGSLR